MYYLYSIRSGGWLSKTSTYTSDLEDAGQFNEADTLRRVKLGKTRHTLSVIPVSVEFLGKVS